MCWYPISLNARITKEGEYISPSLVPCGRCIECLQAKRSAWSFRLKQELLRANSATFLTLTLNDEHLKWAEPTHDHEGSNVKHGPYWGSLDKKSLQDYFKRVRSANNGQLVYYAVGEYGEKNHRPHYHAIVYNSDNNLLRSKWSKDGQSMGIVATDSVSEASIHYVTGYVLKKYGEMDYNSGVSQNTYPEGIQKPFAIMSKGIGVSYCENAKEYHLTNETFKSKDGLISRYLKSKIFKENELLRLKITEAEKIKIEEKLREQSRNGKFTSRQYYRALIKHSQKKKNL